MKRFVPALICATLIAAAAAYSVHLAGLSRRAAAIPRTLTVDFSSGGTVWKRRTIRTAESLPLTQLGEPRLRIMRSYAEKKYGASSLEWFCARSIAATAVDEMKDFSPAVKAADKLSLAALLRITRGKKELALLFLNRKSMFARLTGFGILSDAAFGKTPDRLSDEEFLALFRFYCAPSKRNIDPALYGRIEKRSVSLIQKDDTFAGNAADFCEKELRRDGLWPPEESVVIETGLDPARQRFLELTAKRCLHDLDGQPPFRKAALKKLPPIEAAALEIDIRTGNILAMIGSIGYGEGDRLNRCESRRQISSTFKPFLYAQAFEDGICTPDTVLTDRPVRMENSDGTPWEPRNFYPYYIGEVKAGNALSLSINTVSVQLIEKVGVSRMASRARRIFAMPDNVPASRIQAEPSLALGSIDLSPLELAKGYLSIASLGEERVPQAVLSVKTVSGRVLLRRNADTRPTRIYSEKTCRMLIPVLQNVIRTGTASKFIRRTLAFDAAGKSGSSPSDSWFAGFTPETLILVWAGYDLPARSAEGKLPEFTVIPFWYELVSAEKPSRRSF